MMRLLNPGSPRAVPLLHAVQSAFVESPTNLLLLTGAGMVIMRAARHHAHWRRVGRVLAIFGMCGMFVLALPITGWLLLRALERDVPREANSTASPGRPPAAIVILSGDDLRAAPGGIIDPPNVGTITLQRLRAGVVLHRRTDLPILVTGGVLRSGDPPIARAMATVLAGDFATPARWIEDRSTTTWENARFSADILQAAGIQSVYVVTNAWHMPRALLAFRRVGLTAVAAPTHYTGPAMPEFEWFVPRTEGWADSAFAMHEWVGLAWYALRH